MSAFGQKATAESGSQAGRISAKSFTPTTFLSRGAAVPFTTPTLAGSRVRPSDNNKDIELIVPNPGGGRGMYVIPWMAAGEVCRPTLHDRELIRRIAEEVSVSPSTIRRVVDAVAVDGLAGPDACDTAKRSRTADESARVIVNYGLLMTLMAQLAAKSKSGAVCPPRLGVPPARAEALAAEAQEAVDTVSSLLGQTTVWTANALETMADLFTSIGTEATARSCRIPSLIATLLDTRAAVHALSETEMDESLHDCSELVVAVADLTLSMSRTVLDRAQAMAKDVTGLLTSWAEDSLELGKLLARPEWLLDGWEQICLIWKHADDAVSRRAAVIEMAGLVPVMPKEAVHWCQGNHDLERINRPRKFTRLHEDWLTGMIDNSLIARNEQLRAIDVRDPPWSSVTVPNDRIARAGTWAAG